MEYELRLEELRSMVSRVMACGESDLIVFRSELVAWAFEGYVGRLFVLRPRLTRCCRQSLTNESRWCACIISFIA